MIHSQAIGEGRTEVDGNQPRGTNERISEADFWREYIGRAAVGRPFVYVGIPGSHEVGDSSTSSATALIEVALPPTDVTIVNESPTVGFRHLLGKWSGRIIALDDSTFTAVLKDNMQPSADEEAEFAVDQVAESDRHLVAVGAQFYWYVGRLDRPGMTGSEIRMRRLPPWSKVELERARSRAGILRKPSADAR